VRPVTVLQAGPCVVTQHKLAVKDGYEAAQIGLVRVCERVAAHQAGARTSGEEYLPPVKFMREVPLETDGAADGDVTVKSATACWSRFLKAKGLSTLWE